MNNISNNLKFTISSTSFTDGTDAKNKKRKKEKKNTRLSPLLWKTGSLTIKEWSGSLTMDERSSHYMPIMAKIETPHPIPKTLHD